MKLFFGKGKIIEDKIYEYLNDVKDTKELFNKTIKRFFNGELKEHKQFIDEVISVHRKESRADDLRREIEESMYGKALLPEFRGDILRMMEALDKLPNKCESVLFMISLQNLSAPDSLKDEFVKLVDVNLESIDYAIKVVDTMFKNPSGLKEVIDKLDKIESASDKIERAMIEELFYSVKIEKCDKILLKELILEIGTISDYGEMIGDLINIINIKVKV